MPLVTSIPRLPVRFTLGCVVALVATMAWRPEVAFGHGDPIQIGYSGTATNTLVIAPTIYDNFNTDENFTTFPDPIGLATIYPGFTRMDNLPANSTTTLSVLSPLHYWNQATGTSSPLPTPLATLTVMRGATASLSVSATGVGGLNPLPMTTFVGSPGEHYHYTAYRLTDPDLSAGLYGFWATISASGTGFTAGVANGSDPFLMVFNYGIDNLTDYETGVGRLALAPVPEPASLVLAGSAAAIAALALKRRSRWHGPRCEVALGEPILQKRGTDQVDWRQRRT
jgi:hypothetical protein